MSATVRITSALHPDGRAYRLIEPRELSRAQLAKLAPLHSLLARAVASRRARRRCSKIFGTAVSILLPDLEPRVLRCLSDDARVRVLETWVDLNVEGGER